MTTEKTPFADIFRAMSEDKVIEFSTPAVGRWIQLDFASVCEIISKKYVTEDRFRIKPATRTITIEVPEPLLVAPKVGGKYFALKSEVEERVWSGDDFDLSILDSGLCFSSVESVEVFGNAVIAAMKPKD